MTAGALCGYLCLVISLNAMAGTAGQVSVCPVQQEFCAGIVVKFPELPVIRVVTGITGIPESALVWIFTGVTVVTANSCIIESG